MGFSLKWAKRSALFSRNGNAFVAATKAAMTATKTAMTTTTAVAAAAAPKKRFDSDCPTYALARYRFLSTK